MRGKTRAFFRAASIGALATLSCLLVSGYPGRGQDARMSGSFQLSSGIIIDRDSNVAYVMAREGGIIAIELRQGKILWHSKDGDKPLGIAGERLISQAEPPNAGNELRIVALDKRTAKVIYTNAVLLPNNVKASVGRTRSGIFNAEMMMIENDKATVNWKYVEQPLRGRPGGRETLPGERGRTPSVPYSVDDSIKSGNVRLELTSGKLEAQDTAPFVRRPQVVLEPSTPDLTTSQFVSADGRNVMNSERIADDSAIENYLWTIFERSRRERLGQIKMMVSFTPFFVNDSTLIYEADAFSQAVQDQIAEEPQQLRARDLRTGDLVWRFPIRDVKRLAPPP